MTHKKVKLFVLILFCISLTGLNAQTVKDIDENVYHTVTIGKQVWMVENLKTTKYNNGDPISKVADIDVWKALETGGYCDYNNDVNNSLACGRLYNWYAVDDKRNIAPKGWHVPSIDEWQILVDYLGGYNVAALKLKKSTGWPDVQGKQRNGTNESGFSALPGQLRRDNGNTYVFSNSNDGILYGSCFWSSTCFPREATDDDENNLDDIAKGFNMYFKNGIDLISIGGEFDKTQGRAVRCIKD